jgi:anti-sigma B factor antagonist
MSTTTIGLDRVGSVAILRIAGDVTSGSESDLMAGFNRAIDDGATAVVLDFSGMEYMNSGGIGLLVTLLVRAQRSSTRLLATGLTDHYREILALTRLEEAIEIHDDEASAIAAAQA